MVNKILCATRNGIGGSIVQVQANFVRALPAFVITGLANNSIQESKQRVQSALHHMGFQFPPLKIAINLAPADLAKSGSHFDLPIALLIALHKKQLDTQEWFAFGELGLDGVLTYNDNIFPLLLEVSLQHKNAKVILPKSGHKLFCHLPHLQIFYAQNLQEALAIIESGESTPEPQCQNLQFDTIEVCGENYYYTRDFALDFAEVKGQEVAKRAALIAASGFHNILYEGSPGCGKSMIAKRIRYILPPMSLEEMIESVKLQSLSAQNPAYSPIRPFRAPHQSASKSSILGSATANEAKPGEIALAHQGVLFFDELPHFAKEVLEAMREPLENNELIISRVHSKITYPTAFLFIGAQNPCPCGNLLSQAKECRCTQKEITSYKARLSEPFLDRIDLFVQMQENEQDPKPSLDSATMQKMVFQAFSAQKQRGQRVLNGKLNEREVEEFCVLDEGSLGILQQASARFGLSHRAIQKLKKLARTIADLDNSPGIRKEHVLQALSYRQIS
ncbi:YifB family Mg chelatase-like AAA ATPase [uncultured Helicobacter sp.]|uniref:YifB family Mg chelatase-like AAA ATPase n=1 Tax=uncultured Helicobacter sp. TaxID=175537 RepID=UPI0026237CCF|nr:YifB family Mg chelatase-like AAA ATPase [uncultured Helicobacter sp.]